MPTPVEKATAYLSNIEADRTAAMAMSKEKAREAMLLKAREEGFRDAMEIFGLNITSAMAPDDIEVERNHNVENHNVKNHKLHRRKRRDIRQMIIQELSYSAKAMTTRQIAKAIDYLQERTETVLNRLANEGEIAQNPDGLWEIVVITGALPDRLTVAA